jgi:hypothetical protein
MTRTILAALLGILLAFGFANARAQTQCIDQAPLPTTPTGVTGNFTSSFDGASLTGVLWRGSCPSNPATSSIFLRLTPTAGVPFVCDGGIVVQNGVQYTVAFFDGNLIGDSIITFCANLVVPTTFEVNSGYLFSAASGPQFDPNQAVTLFYGIAPIPVVSTSIPAGSGGSAAPIVLGGYLSGNWFNPAQSGHGFQLELTNQPNGAVPSENEMVAIWFVYTPDGTGQNWIYAQGPYDSTKNTVTLPATIFHGARFPFPLTNYNPADVQGTLGDWGSLTFTFTDCNNGTASWNSTATGYGNGSIPLTRLTSIQGTTCPQ